MTQKPLPPRLLDIPQDHLIHIGGPIDEVAVALRFFGEVIDPDEITRLLGCKPSSVRRKGEVVPDKRYHRIASTGFWILRGQDDKKHELEF